METHLAKLPYGISNFKRLVEEGYYYVDKTQYLERLEQFSAPYLFFLRPRRFGKSLWISLMSYYYGKEHKRDFEQLFDLQRYLTDIPNTLRKTMKSCHCY